MGRSLASRIALLVVAVVAATVVVAGVLATELVRQTSTTSARQQLVGWPTTAETRADRGDQRAALLRVKRLLRTLNVQLAVLNANGRVVGNPAVAAARHDRRHRRRCGPASSSPTERDVDGHTVFVEARPTADGGVVLRAAALGGAGGGGAVGPTDAAGPARRGGDRDPREHRARARAGPAAASYGAGGARPRRRPPRRAGAGRGTRRGRRRRRLGQRDRRGAAALRGPAAHVPDVGVARPAHAADGDPGLRRVDARRCRSRATCARSGEVLTGESLRLERLVEDLLDLARLQADRFRVDLAEADVADVVAETGRAWEERCRQRGVLLSVDERARGSG